MTHNQDSDTLTIKQMPVSERPYELLEANGASSLTDAQLIAILWRSGLPGETSVQMATRILSSLDRFGQDPLLRLCQLSLAELRALPGIGRVKALQIHAAAEIGKRVGKRAKTLKRIPVSSEILSSMYMDRMRFGDRESAWVCYLNAKNELIDELFLGYGMLNAVLVDQRQIFKKGFECGAHSFVLLHSHPSGDPEPSEQDEMLTLQLLEASKLMQLYLTDHIIIGDQCYYSFREENAI